MLMKELSLMNVTNYNKVDAQKQEHGTKNEVGCIKQLRGSQQRCRGVSLGKGRRQKKGKVSNFHREEKQLSVY